MRRIMGLLVAVLALGAFGGSRPADAAAWMWVSAPGWSYSAATCAAAPGSSFYAWALFTGPTYAWTACSGAFGSSASGAAAVPGVGGAGYADAVGAADPYADLSIDTTSMLGSPNNYTSETTDFSVSTSGDEMTGITFPSGGLDSILGGADQLDAYLYTGASACSTFATLLGLSCSGSSETSAASTDISDFDTANGFTLLGSESDPASLTSLPFSIDEPTSDEGELILVAEGDAVSTPEPASGAVFSVGLLALGLVWAGLRRRA